MVAQGTTFGRFARALGISNGFAETAKAFAFGQGWDDPDLFNALTVKAASEAISLDEFASGYRGLATDLADFLRPRTIIGRLPLLRRMPIGVARMIAQTGGARAAFAAEGRPLPTAELTFYNNDILLPRRLGAIVAVSKDLLASSSPAAEAILVSDLTAGIIEVLDDKFVDPLNAGDDDTPASIFYGAPTIASSGSTVAAIDADLQALLDLMESNGMTLETGAWVMSSRTKRRMMFMRSGGLPAYPELVSGRLLGLPVIDSATIGHLGSPGSSLIGLVEQQQVLLADESQAEVDMSKEAAIQMRSDPSTGAMALFSTWQVGCVAFKVQRMLNWKLRATGATAFISGVDY